MCGSLTPANAEQHRKREALSVVGRTPEGLTKAMSHDTSAPSVNGQTLEGITSEANLSSMEQPESTTILSVTAISSYSINGHIQGAPVTFLVDTGSIITNCEDHSVDQSRPQLSPAEAIPRSPASGCGGNITVCTR